MSVQHTSDTGLPRVAVVGAGIAGLAAARRLQQRGLAVTLFEREQRLGGHAHTVPVTLPDTSGAPVTHGVDTGFLVYNERTYPGLIALFDELGVATAPSDMSFSVQAPNGLGGLLSRRLEWSGSSLSTVFAQRRNLLSPRFLWMLREVLRFNRLCTAIAASGDEASLAEPLQAFLQRHRFGAAFRQGYLLPMIACIWSCPLEQMLHFPVATLIRFCHNHGLLQVEDRPRWRTVRDGSVHYVQAVARELHDVRLGTSVLEVHRDASGVSLRSTGSQGERSERFAAVVLACHAPQALRMLGEHATPAEQQVLSGLRTQPNVAVLHTDASVMPQARRAWAAWNFERTDAASDHDPRRPVCLHYWINRLQPLPFATDVFVSLNPLRKPREDAVLGHFDCAHPVFDAAAAAALRRLPMLQGTRHTWYAGAWTGYGFHEDGLKSGVAAAAAVADALGGRSAPLRRVA